MARTNAKNAFLGKKIDFKISSFEDMMPPEGGDAYNKSPLWREA
jgi:hypothetical protein